jgi:hypothetical protein
MHWRVADWIKADLAGVRDTARRRSEPAHLVHGVLGKRRVRRPLQLLHSCPAAWPWLDAFHDLSSGSADRHALPPPDHGAQAARHTTTWMTPDSEAPLAQNDDPTDQDQPNT